MWQALIIKIMFHTLIQKFSRRTFYLTLVLRLGVTPSSVFASLKKIMSRIGRSRFITFPEYEWGTRINSQSVDRCTGSCLACRQTHTNYFETGEILSSCSHVDIQTNASKVSNTVMLEAKATFSTAESLKKVFTNKCDIDKRRKQKYGYSNRKYPKVWEISSKFQRRT